MGDKKNENAKLYKEVFENKELRNFFILLSKYYETANNEFLKRYNDEVLSLNNEYECEVEKFENLKEKYRNKTIQLRGGNASIKYNNYTHLSPTSFTFKGVRFLRQDVGLLHQYIEENKNSNIEIKVEFSIEKNYNKILEEKNLEEYEKLKAECEKLEPKLDYIPRNLLTTNFWNKYNNKLSKLHTLELKLQEEAKEKEKLNTLKSFTFYELHEINTFFIEIDKFNKFSEQCDRKLYELKKKKDNERSKFKYALELLRKENLVENYEYIKDKFLSCDTIMQENTKGILTDFDRKKYSVCNLDINLIDLFLEYLIEEKKNVDNLNMESQKRLIKK